MTQRSNFDQAAVRKSWLPNGSKRCHFAIRWLSICSILVLAVLTSNSHAQLRPSNQTNDIEATSGSSSRNVRLNAVSNIPFAELNDDAQRRIRQVVTNPSFYRRLPVATIDADPDHFRFLIRKPEVVVSIWQLMGVTQMTTKRIGPYTVDTDDGAGTLSQLELMYGNNDLHVFYGSGSYQGPVLKRKMTGRCVILVRTQSSPKQGGGFDLTNQLDVFLKVDNATAAFVTRTLQPVVGSTADHNFVESLKFIERLNQTTRNNGPGVKGMASRLSLDEKTRLAYEDVIDRVFARAYTQTTGQSLQGGTVQARFATPDAARQTTQNQSAAASSNLELYHPSSRQYNYFGGVAETPSARKKAQPATTRKRYVSPPVNLSRSMQGNEQSSSQSVSRPRPKQENLVRGNGQPPRRQAVSVTSNLPRQNVQLPHGPVGPGEGYSILVGGPRSNHVVGNTNQTPSRTTNHSMTESVLQRSEQGNRQAIRETFSSPGTTLRFSDASANGTMQRPTRR
ncbi:MAG: hypothetical protein AAFN77_00320 [Planctomycetota bacterium]